MNLPYSRDDPTITWLLQSATPSIRWLTLHNLLGLPASSPAAQAARRAMREGGPIPAILAEQSPEGWWVHRRHYYSPKYTASHWSMLLLAELDADPDLPGVQRGIEHMLSATQGEVEQHLCENSQKYICFFGNLLRYAIHARRLEDPRVGQVLEYINQDTRIFRFRCPYNGDLPCAWGAVRALWGLAAVPPEAHTPQIKETIAAGLDFLLEGGSLVAADYPTSGAVHPLWFRLNFPLFYSADILFTLRVLKELGALAHPRAQEALEWLRARRTAAGIWHGASPYRQRTWPGLLGPDDAHRWVSLQAMTVLMA